MDLRGRGDVQVLTKGQFDVSPSYAPNGAEIIYASRDRARRARDGQFRRPRAGTIGVERG
jgi:Tol biopolymer transport system component